MIEFSNEIHSIIILSGSQSLKTVLATQMKIIVFIKMESIFFVHKRALTVRYCSAILGWNESHLCTGDTFILNPGSQTISSSNLICSHESKVSSATLVDIKAVLNVCVGQRQLTAALKSSYHQPSIFSMLSIVLLHDTFT